MTFINKRKALIVVLAVVLAAGLFVLSLAFYRNIPYEKSEKRVHKPHYPRLEFAIALLNQLQKDEPNENIFYSPHSVYSTLLLAYLGSAGETEKELKKLLRLEFTEKKANVESAYELKKQQYHRFQSQSIIEFYSVDKFYVSSAMKMR